MATLNDRSGVYDELLLEEVEQDIPRDAQRDVIPLPDGADALAYVASYFGKIARYLGESSSSVEQLANVLHAVGETLGEELGQVTVGLRLAKPLQVLRRIATTHSRFSSLSYASSARSLSLHRSRLYANERGLPPLKDILDEDIRTADEILIVMAFVKTSGVTLLHTALEHAINAGVRIRLVTSLYMLGHDAAALERLAQLGVHIRIDLNRERSNLHAKGWLFQRNNGHSTAVIGSSNLSAQALARGKEWNLRISEQETPHLVDEFRAFFESLWTSGAFQTYHSETHRPLIEDLLQKPVFSALADIRELSPLPHQIEALKALRVSRELGNTRDLIVAATGTGKTAIAAFDYVRLTEALGRRPRMVFIAHRQEILVHARNTFRRALSDPSFGELWVGDHQPSNYDHLFVSVQTLARRVLRGEFTFNHYQHIIIDEFHHAQAETYQRIIQQIDDQTLVGLTATPERSDGVHVQDAFFDGRITYELRLVDALNSELITPFQYFGVSDGTDLRSLQWTTQGYQADELDNVYTGNDIRLRYVLSAMERYIDEPSTMRALGFCVSIRHAEFMARRFNEHGIASRWLSGEHSESERREAIEALERGELRAIFTVDLFNEGVDIPAVDTLLMLRPTQSRTLFIQQIGRGLRHHAPTGKAYCTILDFIGQHHRGFRFEANLAALANHELNKEAIEHSFPMLPSQCLIHLEPIVKEQILEKISSKNVRKTRTRAAIFTLPAPRNSDEESFTLDLSRLEHIDDHVRLQGLIRIAEGRADENVPLLNRMLCCELVALNTKKNLDYACVDQLLARLPSFPEVQRALLAFAHERTADVHHLLEPFSDPQIPLCIHASYTRMEITVALTEPFANRPRPSREGVFYNEPSNTDIFFVTIVKDASRFSESTRYHDFAESRNVFAWDSQNSCTPESTTGRRYLHNSSRKLLFAREYGKVGSYTHPFHFLGEVQYLSHHGSRPIHLRWSLDTPLPVRLLPEMSSVVDMRA